MRQECQRYQMACWFPGACCGVRSDLMAPLRESMAAAKRRRADDQPCLCRLPVLAPDAGCPRHG